jgi:hypothetical protein
MLVVTEGNERLYPGQPLVVVSGGGGGGGAGRGERAPVAMEYEPGATNRPEPE